MYENIAIHANRPVAVYNLRLVQGEMLYPIVFMGCH